MGRKKKQAGKQQRPKRQGARRARVDMRQLLAENFTDLELRELAEIAAIRTGALAGGMAPDAIPPELTPERAELWRRWLDLNGRQAAQRVTGQMSARQKNKLLKQPAAR